MSATDRPPASGTEIAVIGTEIAVVGMAGRFPGARDPDELWRNLEAGVESIRSFTPAAVQAAGVPPGLAADPAYVRAGGALDDIELFDAAFFGYPPREAELMDPQHRLFLECAWEALEEAACDPARFRGPIGVFAGSAFCRYLIDNIGASRERLEGLGDLLIGIGHERDSLTSKVSYKLDLRGPSLAVQTFCSTSLVAVHLACRSLLDYECDAALAGGVAIDLPQERGYLWSEGGILSPDGHCRALDARAQGSVMGNGVGVVVLKRLADALADGDPIRAVIKGSAVNNDGGRKVGYTAPGAEGQAAVIAEALAAAGVDPATIGYIETHGTGTPLGDAVEIAAMKRAFAAVQERERCLLGSLKTNVGHLDRAAGVAGLIKTVLVLERRRIPKTLHFTAADPEAGLAGSPFRVNTEVVDWPAGGGSPRRAAVSSFGIGGTNAHVVLEEAPAAVAEASPRPCQVLVLSARTESALASAGARLAAHLRRHPGLPLADVAFTLQAGRSAFNHRRMLVAGDVEEAAGLLDTEDPARVLQVLEERRDRPVAFLLPGLGEHYAGMGHGLYETEPVFRAELDRCAELLRPELGLDLRAVLYPQTASGEPASPVLERTALAQPALFAVEYALARLWMAWGIRPAAMLGYSLGELVAACLAGVFPLAGGLRLVARRARRIEALPAGAMLAVPLPHDQARALCGPSSSVAAQNGPALSVVAGPVPEIEALAAELAARGLACRRLRTSHAFHSPAMQPLVEELTELVAAVPREAPRIPFLSNVTGTWITSAQALDPGYWARHLAAPVRFAAGLGELLRGSDAVLLEIGPGQSLGALARAHPECGAGRLVLPSLRHEHARHARDARGADAELLSGTLGRLWLAGAAIDWQGVHAGARRQRLRLPTYPFERRRYWIDRPAAPAEMPASCAPPPAAREGGKKADLAGWFYEPVWRDAPLSAAAPSPGRQRWLLLVDATGVGEALARRLLAADQEVVTVAAGEDLAVPGDYLRLWNELREQGRLPSRIVHLWSLGPGGERGEHGEEEPLAARWPAERDRGFYALLFLVQALAQGAPQAVRIAVAGSGLAVVGSGLAAGGERLRPERAPLLGLARVVPQELPGVSCRVIDLDDLIEAEAPGGVDVVAERLAAELIADPVEPAVAYRDARRLVLDFAPLHLADGQGRERLRAGGVYLITGGLGRVGLALAAFLARTCGARLVLVGRSALPDRAEWDAVIASRGPADRLSRQLLALGEIEAVAGALVVEQADVADRESMRAVIARCRERFGSLHGVIHAAGLTSRESFGSLLALGAAECEAHFRPKVMGALVLAELLAGSEIDFCLLMSSLSTVLGGLGFGPYAAANAMLDALAEERAAAGEPWRSVDWDGWQDARARQEPRHERSGLGATLDPYEMTPDEGVAAFVRTLAPVSAGRIVVSTGELAPRLAQWVSPVDARPGGTPATLYARPELQTAFVPPGSEMERRIAAAWQRVLGIGEVGIHDNFFELGGNSLLGMQMMAGLRGELGLPLSAVALFEAPTVSSLAALLAGQAPQTAVAPIPAAPAAMATAAANGHKVAIIGMAGRFPGAESVDELWANLLAGRETVSFFTDEELLAAGVPAALLRQPNFVKARPILPAIDLFDAQFFGYNPREAACMDPQHRIFMQSAWHALENAGYDPFRYPGEIGLFAGCNLSSYMLALHSDAELAATVDPFQVVMGNDKDSLPTSVSYKLNLRGPSFAVQSYCSTSLVAVHLACRSLASGECSMALAGGVSLRVPQKIGYLHQPGGQDSADGHTRSFDVKASGSVFGDATAVVVLKRLDEALAAGDTIHAVILGSAVTNDGGLKAGFTAPTVDGQARAVTAALAMAAVDPSTVGMVEAHGSATPLGDPIEVAALTRSFRRSTGERGFCALGSVKSNVGHLDRAAGVTGLLKATLAVREGVIPATLHFTAPNPELNLPESPFFVNAGPLPWPAGGTPRRAGVNSIGSGGTNAHVVLEEAPPPLPTAPSSRRWHLLPLSARSGGALETASAELARHLESLRESPDAALADVSWTLQTGRRAFEHRRVVLCRDAAEAAAALSTADPRRVFSGSGRQVNRRIAFLFPGLGDHYVGMARGLYRDEPVFRRELDRCAEILRPQCDLLDLLYPGGVEEEEDGKRPPAGVDLRALLRGAEPSPADRRLDRTAHAQPATFAIEWALAHLWLEWGMRPDSLIGYSLGEYVAACLAGVFTLEDGLSLVAHRARLIEELPAGAMLGVSLTAEEVQPLLGDDLWLAAINGPALVVVAGTVPRVESLERQLGEREVACRRIVAGHAFHSGMMQPLAGPLAERIAALPRQPPRIPFVSNVTGTWITPEQATDPDYWARHLCQPVRWSDGLRTLAAEPDRILLEVGPGQTLGSLARQQEDGAAGAVVLPALRHRFDRQEDLAFALATLGRLWIAGAEPDWAAFHGGGRRRRVPLPVYPFEARRHWLEPAPGAKRRARSVGQGKRFDVADWFYLPVWKASPRPAQPVRPDAGMPAEGAPGWLVFASDSGLDRRFCERLRQAAGGPVTVVRAGAGFAQLGPLDYVLDPRREDGYDRLLRELGEAPCRIAHLWSAGEPPSGAAAGSAAERFALAQEMGFHSLTHLARALARANVTAPVRLCVLSSGVFPVTGAEPLCPERATLAGPCRVMPQELLNITCRAIDIALPEPGSWREERLAERLVAEVLLEETDLTVAYRGRDRWVQSFEPVRLEKGTPALRQEGVYLLTGGLGGVGLILAEHLARAWRARLVLVGRSALPARERWRACLETAIEADATAGKIRRLLALEELGAEILVLEADVADERQLRAVLDRARERFGRIDGVIHAAGITGEDSVRSLHELTEAGSAAQFRPKVAGLHALEGALRGEPLDFVLLFSSIAAVLGGLGFTAYTAANAYMDAFAHALSRESEVEWLAVNWDSWPSRDDQYAVVGGTVAEFTMTREEGAEAFERVLAGAAGPQIVHSTGDLEARIEQWIKLESSRQSARRSAGDRHERPDLGNPYVPPGEGVERAIADVWQELLGIEPVGLHDNFFELGGHSLLATQLFSRLRGLFQVELPLRSVFEAPTVAGLAALVDATRAEPAVSEAPALVPLPRDGELPLSFAQQRLWFLEQLAPGDPFYNIGLSTWALGRFEYGAFARCLAEIGRRHEVLRTAFAAVDGRPVLRISPAPHLPLEIADLRGLPEERRQAEGVRLGIACHRQAFDLAAGPLLRCRLARLGDREYLLFLTLHHSIADGWSLDILRGELVALYEAFAAGLPSPLPELPVQYADFAGWQRPWLEGEVMQRQLGYWEERMRGPLPVLALPTDRPRPARQSHRGATLLERVAAPLSDRLRELSQRHEATLYMTMLAAFQTLLSRYTGQTDVVVGSPIACRGSVETERLIGLFANILPLRADLSADPPFSSLLAQVREVTLGAYANQDLPFERLVEHLQPERSLGHTPLFQAALALDNTPGWSRGSLQFVSLALESGTAKFDLELLTDEREASLPLAFEHSTDLFDGTTMRRLAGHFQVLLAGIAGHPDQRLSELPLLAAAERHALLVETAAAPRSGAAEGSLYELFAARAGCAPDAVALTCEEQSLTYGGLERRVRRLARRLRELGVGPEVPVGLCLERGPRLVVAILAVLRAGGAYVPVDPAYPRERQALLLGDSRPAVILCERRLVTALPAGGAIVLGPDEIDEPGDAAAIDGVEEAPSDLSRHLAYVIYTSGSTGRPKGVLVEQRSVVRLLRETEPWLGSGERDVWTLFHSYAFDFSVWEIWGALAYGGRLVIVPYWVSRSAEALHALLRREGVTVLNQTPSAFRELAAADRGEEPLPALRRVVLGGEALLPAGLAPWLERYGDERPLLANMYGITETTVHVTWRPLGRADAAAPGSPIGRAIPDLEVRLLDRRLEPAPIGVPAELCVGGPGLARGYLGRPDLTAERFVPDPYGGPGARLYRSGDLARLTPRGELEHLGRIDSQVKIRGHRIELGEIETVLGGHPGVCAAVAQIAAGGSGGPLLAAYVVPAGPQVTAAELREYLRLRLPEPMVPGVFLLLERLPLTAHGKVDRRALPAPRAAGDGEHVAPRTPIEVALAALWTELLGVERVGAGDSFFDLGGHSLLAARLASRVRDAFAVELPLRDFFEAPTLRGLAERIAVAGRGGTPAPPILPLLREARQGEIAASFAQERLWLLDQLEPGSARYNIPLAIGLTGPLAVEALAGALTEIVRRHEALRTSLPAAGGRPCQRIAPPLPLPLPIVDLSALGEAARQRQTERLDAEEAARPFDLARGPVLRATLLQLAERRHALLLVLHHVAGDAWSVGLLLRELSALYEAAVLGRPSPLPELPVQYADFAAWQRSWLSGEVLEAELGYWRGRLAGAPPALDLPADRPRPPVMSDRGALRRGSLPAGLALALQALARQRLATPFMALLASFYAILRRYTGQTDLVVGSPIANRGRVETEAMIGLFVNTLALRTDLAGDPDFRQLLGRVRETALGAYAHQDLPFERLVDELRPERDLGRTPLFQVMLTLGETPAVGWRAGGLELEMLPLASRTAKLDLELVIEEGVAGGLAWAIEHSTDLFDASTVDRFARHWETLLAAAVAEPATPLSQLSSLGAVERHQLREWNAVGAGLPEATGAHRLVAAQAERTPDAVAVSWDGGCLTYGELRRRTVAWAAALAGLGTGPERVVAVLAERGPELVCALLAILEAGGAYLPLDPRHPPSRWCHLLAQSGAGLVLCGHGLAAPLAQALPAGGSQPAPIELAELSSLAPAAPPSLPAVPLGLAYVIFTSGSSGAPKAAMIEHGGMINHLLAKIAALGLTAADAVAQTASQGFDISLWQMLAPLLVVGRVHIVADEAAADPRLLAAEVERAGVTVLETVPSLLSLLVERDRRSPGLAGLRWMIPTGEALPAELCRSWFALYPSVPLLNAYGPTECADDVSHEPLREPPALAAVGVAIGRPIPNLRLAVVDRTDGAPQLLPVGVPGELCVGGVGVGRGYLGEPARTAVTFVPDPWGEAGARLYWTGDRARHLADGRLELLGRLDRQVKIRGHRVEPEEVEAVLVTHPAVAAAAVVAHGGADGLRLAAFLVLRRPPAGAGEEPPAWLLARLPEAFVPASFTVLSALPLTGNGKVDRRALERQAPPAAVDGGMGRPPATPDEQRLAALWTAVLGVETPGADDDFFALGGHSLLAARLAAMVRDAFAVELPLRAVFEARTLSALALRIAGSGRAQVPRIQPVPRGGDLEPSFAQMRLWFVEQLEPGTGAYNIPAAVRLSGRLDVAALARSCSEVLRRHEVLRTTFPAVDGGPVQRISPPRPLTLPMIDLQGLEEPARGVEARRLAAWAAFAPLDLAAGPLVRVLLLRHDATEHTLAFTVHHIAFDEWSAAVLVREVAALYRAFLAGDPSPLPEPSIQYADFAAWQRRWLADGRLAAELAYWRERLRGIRPQPLPADHPRPERPSPRGARLTRPLPAALAAELAPFAHRQEATPFMVLLAAFAVLLHRFTQRDDVILGTAAAGRTQEETADLIGYFINMLVLRTDLSGNPAFSDLLAQVREVVLGALSHQELPFDKLVEDLRPGRDAAGVPLVPAAFGLNNVPGRSAELPGLRLRTLEPEVESVRFDLTLWILEEEDGALTAAWSFRTDLFDRTTVERLHAQYVALLASAMTRPAARLDRLGVAAAAPAAPVVEGEWRIGRRRQAAVLSQEER